MVDDENDLEGRNRLREDRLDRPGEVVPALARSGADDDGGFYGIQCRTTAGLPTATGGLARTLRPRDRS